MAIVAGSVRMVTDGLPPAGWYPDPAGAAAERWWDGRGWTGHLRPGPAQAQAGWGAPVGAGPTVAAGLTGGPWRPRGSWPSTEAPAPTSGPNSPTDAWPPMPASAGAPRSPSEPDGGPSRRIPARAAWIALAGLAGGEVVGGLLAAGGMVASNSSSTGAIPTLLGEIGLWAGMLGAVVVTSRTYGTGSLRRDFTLGFRTKDLLFGVAAAIIGTVVVDLIGVAFAGTSLSGTNTQILTGQKGNSVGFVIVSLIAAVGAPFFEELFFRGLLRTALASRLGPIGAIWAQAALFGLAHFEPTNGLGNVSIMVAIGAFGLVLGYTAHFSRRLGAGMVAHSLFNIVAVVAILAT
jgi:membrane protease YdiL (CAAX protease family)